MKIPRQVWAKQGSASKKLGSDGPKASDGKLPFSVYTIAPTLGTSKVTRATLISWCQARCDEWSLCEFFEAQPGNMRCALQWPQSKFGVGDDWSQAKATMPLDWLTLSSPGNSQAESGHWMVYDNDKAIP